MTPWHENYGLVFIKPLPVMGPANGCHRTLNQNDMISATPDLVSIIIPCWNRARLIVETLDSIAAQTYSPIEIVVVDDGSTDKSADVVKHWTDRNGSAHKHIAGLQCIRQENAGPSAARNRGFCASQGEFIQFLDSDDILHREKLAMQVSAMRKEGADFCVCNFQPFVETWSTPGPVVDFYNRSHSVEDFPALYPMDTPAPLYRRDVVCANGPWDEGLRAGEDFEYNFRMVARGARGVWINTVLLYVRKHNGQERIQAAPLEARCRSMYLGLAKMEMEAITTGVCSRRLLDSLGMRAYQYHEHMKAEGSLAQAEVFLRFARPRLFWTTRAALLAKRVLPAPVIQLCVLAKRMLHGAKR